MKLVQMDIDGYLNAQRFVKMSLGIRFDEEPAGWITVNGNHIPVNEKGEAIGGQQKALGESEVSGLEPGFWKQRERNIHKIEDIPDGFEKCEDGQVRSKKPPKGFTKRTLLIPKAEFSEVMQEINSRYKEGKFKGKKLASHIMYNSNTGEFVVYYFEIKKFRDYNIYQKELDDG